MLKQIKKYKIVIECNARSEAQARFLVKNNIMVDFDDMLAEGVCSNYIRILHEEDTTDPRI
jgi:hypothetical protein